MTRAASIHALVVAAALAALPGAAFAQGKSGQTPAATHSNHGKPSQLGAGPTTTTGGTPTAGTVSLSNWLDDASLLGPGNVWVSGSAATWKNDSGRIVEAPILNVAAGVAPRVNLGIAVPFYRFKDTAGVTESGVADVMLFGKIGLRTPEAQLGVALTPIVDVAGSAPTDGSSRVSFALPISIERRASEARVYASGGYWTNGALFGTGALEFTVAPKVLVSGSLGYSYATRVKAADVGLSRYRTDISATVTVAPASSFGVFLSAGHAFSGTPSVDGGPWIAGGISIRAKGR